MEVDILFQLADLYEPRGYVENYPFFAIENDDDNNNEMSHVGAQNRL